MLANSARSYSHNGLDDARGIDLPRAFFFYKVSPLHQSRVGGNPKNNKVMKRAAVYLFAN